MQEQKRKTGITQRAGRTLGVEFLFICTTAGLPARHCQVDSLVLATAVQEIRAEEKTSATIIDVILKDKALRK